MNTKVLIVEDEPIISMYLEGVIKKIENCEVVGNFSSGEVAIEYIKEYSVDLVFMDINIAGQKDGIQCSKEINKIRFTPTIFVTAYSSQEIIKEAMEDFVVSYLVKPIDEANIQAATFLGINKIKQHVPTTIQNNKIQLTKDSYYLKDSKQFFQNSSVIKFTNKEFALLELLITNLDTTVSLEQISQTVWNKEVSTSALRGVVVNIRNKLPEIDLESIYAQGYILKSFNNSKEERV